ncbi:hypothetical protein L1281_001663 [Neisseria sp. HSC-16F19]|nr:hypothetical protein [Neisseria sp. HSC-16F19]
MMSTARQRSRIFYMLQRRKSPPPAAPEPA